MKDRISGELKFSEYMSELEALDFNEASIGTLMRLDYTMRIR